MDFPFADLSGIPFSISVFFIAYFSSVMTQVRSVVWTDVMEQ